MMSKYNKKLLTIALVAARKNSKRLKNKKFKKDLFFGKGDSSKKILKVLNNNTFWNMSLQKIFSKY